MLIQGDAMKIIVLKRIHMICAIVLTFTLLLAIIVLSIHKAYKAEDVMVSCILEPAVIIDAGHGGADGGAESASGICEAPLNLDISIKLREMLSFAGVTSLMTRDNDDSLDYSADKTIKENKTADLKARLMVAINNPDCDFLSIHLNKFEQEKYHGAQVFYSPNNSGSSDLALSIQQAFRVLDPDNQRRAKMASDGIYLMKNIKSPAVTIECGFLSNNNDAKLLSEDIYRTKIALAIYDGYIDYLEMSEIKYAT